eukprot:16339028-Heterocapsa_arctica.AAC.1
MDQGSAPLGPPEPVLNNILSPLDAGSAYCVRSTQVRHNASDRRRCGLQRPLDAGAAYCDRSTQVRHTASDRR